MGRADNNVTLRVSLIRHGEDLVVNECDSLGGQIDDDPTKIRPTLMNLGSWNPATKQFLLATAINAPSFGLFSTGSDGLGIFRVTSAQHRDIRDQHLAYNPELASRVRNSTAPRGMGDMKLLLSFWPVMGA